MPKKIGEELLVETRMEGGMEWEKGLKRMNEMVMTMVSITESGESPSTGYDHPFNVRELYFFVICCFFRSLILIFYC